MNGRKQSRNGNLMAQSFGSEEVKKLFDSGKEPMQSVVELFSLRNALMHSKQKELNVHEYNTETGELKIGESSRKPWPYDLSFEDTKNYLKVVEELVKGLKLVDPTITNEWLDNDWATCSIQLLDRYDSSDE